MLYSIAVARYLMITLYLYLILLFFITYGVVTVALTGPVSRKNKTDGNATISQHRIFDIGLHRKTLDLAKHAKLTLEKLSETKRLDNNNIFNNNIKNNLNQKIKILRSLTNQIIGQAKSESSLELEYQRKVQVLKKAIINYNFIMHVTPNRSFKRSNSDAKIKKYFTGKHRKIRSAGSILENSPVQRILYNLDSLKEDLGRWENWIEKSSSKWNNERRTAFASAVHLLISALYQYKRITYQIMFDKNLLSSLALDMPVPRNDFFFNHNRTISFTKVGSKVLIKINDKEYQSRPHEYKVGGLVALNNGLTKDSISNFTKDLQLSREQEEGVIDLVNENVERSIFRWSLWGQWSGCSVTCGMNGVKVRQRVCVFVNLNSNFPSCSGGDTERILCSATQACQKKSEILCWVEGFGFLKENTQCECTFVPHLCMNGGECQKRALTNGSMRAFPHYALACQCPIGFSGPVCENAWFTIWNILVIGGIGVVMIISFVLSFCFCVQKFKKSKSEKLTPAETLGVSQSANAGNSGDEEYFTTNEFKNSEYLDIFPGRIENNPLFNTSLLVNPTKSIENVYADKMNYYVEPKNTNVNTSVSPNAVEETHLNNGDNIGNYDNGNVSDNYDSADKFLSNTANMLFQETVSSRHRSPTSENNKECHSTMRTSSTSQKSDLKSHVVSNSSKEVDTPTMQNESNTLQISSETSPSDVTSTKDTIRISKVNKKQTCHSADDSVMKNNFEAYRIFKNTFLNRSIHRDARSFKEDEIKNERSRSSRMKSHCPIKSNDRFLPIVSKSLKRVHHKKTKHAIHKKARERKKERVSVVCPYCNPQYVRNFPECCRNCRNYDNIHDNKKMQSKVDIGKQSSLEHIVGLPINSSHRLKNTACQHSICKRLHNRLMFNKDIFNSIKEDINKKGIVKVGAEDELTTRFTREKIKAFKAFDLQTNPDFGNHYSSNIQKRLIFS